MKSNLYKNLVKVSKICIYIMILQLCLYTFTFAIDSNAQQKSVDEISIKMTLPSPANLQVIFEEIESSTDFKFSHIDGKFKTYQIKLDKQIDNLGDLLREISSQANLLFRRVDEIIYVKKSIRKDNSLDVSIVEILLDDISGIVVDENGEPLPGASILEKGTTNGTITDLNGNFSINVEEGATLQISFIGYITEEITVGTQNTINIQLKPDIASLEEVVVVGYGTQQKKDLTGSISSLSSAELKRNPVTSLEQGIRGMAAGVYVSQNSSQPGGVSTIRIRGGNSITAGNEPLYVIPPIPEPLISEANEKKD